MNDSLNKFSTRVVLFGAPIAGLLLGAFLPAVLELGLLRSIREPTQVFIAPNALWSFIGTLSGLIISIQLAIFKTSQSAIQELTHQILDALRNLSDRLDDALANFNVIDKYVRVKQRHKSRVVRKLADTTIAKYVEEFEEMVRSKDCWDLHAIEPMDSFVERFAEIMSDLVDSNTTFRTFTNPVFWSRDHIGSSQKYWVMNITAVEERGISIERLFRVPNYDAVPNDKRFAADVMDALRIYDDKLGNQTGIETKVLRAKNENEYEEHFGAGTAEGSSNFALWETDGKKVCLIVFFRRSSLRDFRIKRIRFSFDKSEIKFRSKLFEKEFHRKETETLGQYRKNVGRILDEGLN